MLLSKNRNDEDWIKKPEFSPICLKYYMRNTLHETWVLIGGNDLF